MKSFLNQTTHSIVMIKNSNALYVYHWRRLIRFRVKILAASDTDSDYAICGACMSVVTPPVEVRTVHV